MWLDPLRYEVIDDALAEVLRHKSPREKLAIVDGLWRLARSLIRNKLRHDHPDWADAELDAETARRMSRGAVWS